MTTHTTKAQGMSQQEKAYLWPALPFDAWKDTFETLHMETQIVGKVALEQHPFLNQWWEVALAVTARGLETPLLPSPTGGAFQISFDFIDHNLAIVTSEGKKKALALMPRTVADFYHDFMAALAALGIQVQVTKVFQQYRSHFRGKSSPINFFWGSFDLAETRFSGKPAAPPQGANRVIRFSEDAEQIACGFWPGGPTLHAPAFYSYTYPEPQGFKNATLRPAQAHYDANLGEFILLYDDVRQAASPEQTLLEFFQSAYESGAKLAHWNMQELEQLPPKRG